MGSYSIAGFKGFQWTLSWYHLRHSVPTFSIYVILSGLVK